MNPALNCVQEVQEISTPGQASRTTVVSENNVAAAPPRIYAALRKSDLGAAIDLLVSGNRTRAACPGVKGIFRKNRSV
jgi:hypothetical protein